MNFGGGLQQAGKGNETIVQNEQEKGRILYRGCNSTKFWSAHSQSINNRRQVWSYRDTLEMALQILEFVAFGRSATISARGARVFFDHEFIIAIVIIIIIMILLLLLLLLLCLLRLWLLRLFFTVSGAAAVDDLGLGKWADVPDKCLILLLSR